MPSPSLKCRHSAISSTVATLEKPHFIGRFSAYSLMEKLRGRYEWRSERDSNMRYGSRTYPTLVGCPPVARDTCAKLAN